MTYNTIEEAYRVEFSRLLRAAQTQLANTDYAIDCVHEAFEKVLVYIKKRPGRKVSGFLLLREVTRAAQKNNKRAGAYTVELTDETTAKSNDSGYTDQRAE